MEIRKLFTGIVLLVMTLAGCTAVNEKQEIPSPAVEHPQSGHSSSNNDDTDVLTIATGDMSGVYFSLGQAIAAIYEKYDGIASAVQVTNASFQNTRLVSEKKADIGFASLDVLSDMENDHAVQNLRVLTDLYFNYIHIIAPKDSGITSIEDLKGKRVSVGPDGSGTKLAAERVLSAYGFDDKKVEKHFLTFSQSADALRNDTIDAAIFSSGLPNPEIAALSEQMPISLIPIPEDTVSELNKAFGNYTAKVIPRGTYQGLDKDIPTISVKNVLLVHKDLPEKKAYQLVKTLYSHLPELQQIHPAAGDIMGTEAEVENPVDYHPGAKKYFQKKETAENANNKEVNKK